MNGFLWLFIEISTLVNVNHEKKNEQSLIFQWEEKWDRLVLLLNEKRDTGGLVVFLHRWCLCPVLLSTWQSGEDIIYAMMDGQRRSMPAHWETLNHSLLLCLLFGAEPTFDTFECRENITHPKATPTFPCIVHTFLQPRGTFLVRAVLSLDSALSPCH